MFTDHHTYQFSDALHGRREFLPYGYQRDMIKRILNPAWNRHVVCSFPSSGMLLAYYVFAYERMLQGESTLLVTCRGRFTLGQASTRLITPSDNHTNNDRIIRSGMGDPRDRLTNGKIDTVRYQTRRDMEKFRGMTRNFDYIFILNANEFHYIEFLEYLEIGADTNSTIVIDGKPPSSKTSNCFLTHYDNAEAMGYKRTTIRHFVHPEFTRDLAMKFIRSYGVNTYRQLFECRV